MLIIIRSIDMDIMEKGEENTCNCQKTRNRSLYFVQADVIFGSNPKENPNCVRRKLLGTKLCFKNLSVNEMLLIARLW